MNAPALGEAAARLPWLVPAASTLAALARSAAVSAWNVLRFDPSAVLLTLRQVPTAGPTSLPLLLQHPEVLDGAVRLTDRPVEGFVDWNRPGCRTVYRASLQYAQAARLLAERSGRVDAEAAWSAGLLAPLGWQALCAVATAQAEACLTDPDLCRESAAVQQRRWGRDQASIARRLCRRWGLPSWLAAPIGHLDLSAEHAVILGAEPNLFRVVQLAVTIVQARDSGLSLTPAGTAEENARALALSPAALEGIAVHAATVEVPAEPWKPPEAVPLLRELLLLAAEKRRVSEAPTLLALEADVDHLHDALREQQCAEVERLRGQKLSALAEFAGGAGHEINNPLAVISGQAQYLLAHESDPTRQRSLQTIIGQTKRIHQILSELMLFARPPKPRKQAVDVSALTQTAVDSLAELASQRRIALVYTPPGRPLTLFADPKQIQTAVLCLLRNAVEAAPAEGWASVRVETPQPGLVHWVVEDNGSGPEAAKLEHLFDPFYSGRHAGRGRGLGLPTAWQLARNHGGEVRFEGSPAGHTRFIFSLPVEPVPAAVPAEPILSTAMPGVEANGASTPH